jgi:2-polyprenyl-3-methyl-5-hydroxy-6-metoxy-1,4-benzoquinol methylase
MDTHNQGAQSYFDKVPAEWDALYAHENRLQHRINQWLRPGLYARHDFTFAQCGEIAGARVLDIGCGTGRFSIEFAKRGAAQVVGVDFAPHMIEFSNNIARQMQVADRCTFVCGDFMAQQFDQPFDIVIGMGLFDYIRDPQPMFTKIATLTRRVFLASFPCWSLVWGLQRHVRYYWIRRCPIYYYTQAQLAQLYRTAPFGAVTLERAHHGFLGAARPV